MESRYLPELSWTQVKDYLERGGDLAVIPLGSTENHGPHAPLGTDSIIAEELCRRLAARLDALVAPVVPLGFCPQHLPFPGSISLSNETISRVLLETAVCLEGQGFRRFVFISGHGGNKTALDLAAGNLKQARPGVQVLHAHVLAVQTSRHIRDKVETAYGKPLSQIWEAHGGEQETAAVMAVRPELVRLAQAEPEPDVTAYLAKGRDTEVFRIDYDLKRHAPRGNWGDPRSATAEQGRLFYDMMADHLAYKIGQKWD
jgi:creatinine amidohydrolase